jgi:hypothetical protein
MEHQDRTAGFTLLETGALVDFHVLETSVEPSPDGKNLHVRVEIQFGDDDEEDGGDIAEWGSFGFIFALAVLSFADARPRGLSERDYIESDEFRVDDLFKCLRFCGGELHFRADYIRGRSMKTEISVKSNGRVTLTTWGRGEVAPRWLDRLQGKKIIQAI